MQSDEGTRPEQVDHKVVPRRGLLRGGAIAVGAAGTAMAAGAVGAGPAYAADGDAVLAGEANEATTTTVLGIGGADGSDSPTLALENVDGPTLRLQALSPNWPGQLQVGEVANTELGPIVGVETLQGLTTTYLVTGLDLNNVQTTFPTEPSRLLDLRTEAGQARIVRRSSATALTATGKLQTGQWIDIAVGEQGTDYIVDAVFANLTVVGAERNGFATLYPPGVRPNTSNVNFETGRTVANAGYTQLGTALGSFVVRLSTSATAWFVLDLTGATARGTQPTPAQQGRQAAAPAGRDRLALVKRIRSAITRAAR